jgi:hypothetical protein
MQNISRGPQGYPDGPNGPAAVLWDTQGGATWKCAVSQDPAVVGPATQLPPYQKMVRFGGLRGARSRQDASKEVHEVGSKRPSSGGNGGHVISLYPLIWRSLGVGSKGNMQPL